MTTKTRIQKEKFELKNVTGWAGRDGYGLNATLYYDGKKIAVAHDDGNGGPITYSPIDNDFYKTKREFELSQPKEKGYSGIELDYSLDFLVAELADKAVQAKQEKAFLKKMEKKMINSIIYGVPNKMDYRFAGFKVPLANLDKVKLAEYIEKTIKPRCVNGVVILNTNLAALGIKI